MSMIIIKYLFISNHELHDDCPSPNFLQIIIFIQFCTPKEKIEVNFNLTQLKPIHANWMVELYNFLTSEEGHVIILNDWKKGDVTGVVEKTEVLPLKRTY